MELKQSPICRLFVVCADATLHFHSSNNLDDGYWEIHNPLHTAGMPRGIRNGFLVREMMVYFQLTDAVGRFTVGVTVEEMDLANPKKDRLIYRSDPHVVVFANPWAVQQSVIQLREVPYPKAGQYRFRLMLEGKQVDGGVAYLRVVSGDIP